MNKLSERDICTKYITPALVKAGWDLLTQIREEVSFTKGRVIVRGKVHNRGKQKRADYILYYKPNIPLAVIEAKDKSHSIGAGIQQALDYAESLDIPFVFSSNGDGFIFHDKTGLSKTIEQELPMDSFPTPSKLWEMHCKSKDIISEKERQTIETPYYDDGSNRSPRYYQASAINTAIESSAKGKNRMLLVMATGTGKTYTAFQIIWRLWKSGLKKRILFLADRNILVDQTKNNDFKPFGSAMTKITKRQIDKSYEIYLSLYQAVTGNEEEKNIYKQFSRDFFDLVVVDECHRGSAKDDSAWRDILEYFSSATQIGLTATPKETKNVSSSDYFGDPIYTYSLRQGIEDGFLAPYKVIRIDIDRDIQGWRPALGQVDNLGQLVEDRIYNQIDMDRTLVLKKRTELVAKKITDFLIATDPYAKTIVFCDDIDHAERMRKALVNLNPDRVSENSKYIMRITGDENEGKSQLDNFINPEERYPVVATTSKLLSTGVDVQTCKLIVLDQHIKSMTEFKQIIGRGTRINEDYDKYWFSIMDFKKATELFADKEFDGDPVQVYEPGPNPPEPKTDPITDPPPEDETGRVKYVIGDVTVYVMAERIQYYGAHGKLITESLKDYTKQTVKKKYSSLDEFLKRWNSHEKKSLIIQELRQNGVLLEPLLDEVGKDFDAFDLICHVVFDQPPLTRRERAKNVKKRNYFTKYSIKARQVLDSLLEKYSDTGIENIEDIGILNVSPFNELGTAVEIISVFGGKEEYINAVTKLKNAIYAPIN
ncbi:DEAD/DEAH box helicase family protein [Candidatus Pelagibacter sp.]|nr:DEAD/DEAH box helicase family protein [Candidatus Pelagibacter sp.]